MDSQPARISPARGPPLWGDCDAQVGGGVEIYRDSGLKWEKISSVKSPPGVDAIYSLRITQSRRATAYRDGDFIRLLTIAPDHDSTYGRK